MVRPPLVLRKGHACAQGHGHQWCSWSRPLLCRSWHALECAARSLLRLVETSLGRACQTPSLAPAPHTTHTRTNARTRCYLFTQTTAVHTRGFLWRLLDGTGSGFGPHPPLLHGVLSAGRVANSTPGYNTRMGRKRRRGRLGGKTLSQLRRTADPRMPLWGQRTSGKLGYLARSARALLAQPHECSQPDACCRSSIVVLMRRIHHPQSPCACGPLLLSAWPLFWRPTHARAVSPYVSMTGVVPPWRGCAGSISIHTCMYVCVKQLWGQIKRKNLPQPGLC